MLHLPMMRRRRYDHHCIAIIAKMCHILMIDIDEDAEVRRERESEIMI